MQIQPLGLVLMSVAIVQYGLIPLFADLNRTHATNPHWPQHARFHVVTQVITGAAVAVIALFVLWSDRLPHSDGVCLAMALSLSVLGSFFASAWFRNRYGGALHDEGHGVRPVRGLDLNVLNFGVALALLLVGRWCAQ